MSRYITGDDGQRIRVEPGCRDDAMSETPERTAQDIPDSELVRRAVAHAMKAKRVGKPAWASVMEVFVLGSTFAEQLCRRCGFDPETGWRVEE